MRTPTWAFFLLTTVLLYHTLASTAFAQSTKQISSRTLSEKLIAEDPVKLAEQARRDGNIVRGAILFHQGNINCAKCHRPTAEKDRIGPDLSRMDREVTDAFIIDSILQPSNKFSEGFEPIIALTSDGRTISGTKVSEDDNAIVIRDGQDIDKLTTILRADLDEIGPGKKSNMPADLANELKNRQQFLDLLRYVIDIKERGPESNSVSAQAAVARELGAELNGMILIQKSNCAACHKSDSIDSPVASKKAPRLNWSAKWLNPNYIQSFIANPHIIKPGTTMPALLGHLDIATRKKSAEAITHFLTSKTKNEFKFQPIDGEAAHRGYRLFHSVGCVACHSPRNEEAIEQPFKDSQDSLPLGELSQKYNAHGLSNFLEDPRAVRPSGHMPNMRLGHGEAVDIANYLLQSSKENQARWETDSELVQQGETLFADHNCASCHTEITKTTPKKASSDVTPTLATELPLEKLNQEQGCLSGKGGAWPNFHFQPRDIKSIQAALNNTSAKLNDQQKIEVTLVAFNCIACHSRGNLGGVTTDRNPHFQTTNMNLGDQGRIPPTLTGVGAKLDSKWMRDVLVNQRSIRPYMNTRMPQYGEENVGHLMKLFESNDRLPETKFAEFKDQKEMRTKGLELAGDLGLNCVACHTYQYKISDTMPAVDLTEMTERLKKDWFYQYMLAPQHFSPNTVMPSFWPGGNAIRKDIEGSPEEQIEALWQYLIDGRQARAPRGVVREPLEIVVTNEARMLRRSYPGIGKRGIGVGYPGGVNIAFDAEQMRLGSVWKGKFADPSGVWTGQGSGNVRPMNRPIDFGKGPELDDRETPWVVDDGRPPKHQFKGYSLDKLQRPTFRYRFESVDVEDFFAEVINDEAKAVHLKRNVAISSAGARSDLSFRIASAKKITFASDRSFLVDDKLTIQIDSNHTARIVESGDGKRLEIPINLDAGRQQILMIQYAWD